MSQNPPQPQQQETDEQKEIASDLNDDGVTVPGDFKNVLEILDGEELRESPINLNITNVIPVPIAPLLAWMNYELPPQKMKITNTGHTVILSGKWGRERPYLCGGVLNGKYVFSQVHLHWGVNDMEGSEHTVDGGYYSGELHVVLFKSCYLTQESALKEKDGVAILVYLLKLQEPVNPEFQLIVESVAGIARAHTSAKVSPVPLSYFARQFERDYFTYRGTVNTTNCVHPISWLITRVPLGVSADQIDSFRYLLDDDGEIIRRNFRPIQPLAGRHVFHILPSTSKYSTLLPAPVGTFEEKGVMQIYRMRPLRDERPEYPSETGKNRENKEGRKSPASLARPTNDIIGMTNEASHACSYTGYIY